MLVLCLAFAFHPFPRRRQILDAGNHSVQQMRLRLLPYSSCLFCLCGHEGPPNGSVGSQNRLNGGTFLPASWQKMIAHWLTRRILVSTMIWGTKVFVVALNDCINSTSSFTLSIVDSEKYLRVSSCAFNLSPLKPSLYNWRTSLKGSSKSSPRGERKSNSCIFLNTIQSVRLITL